MSRSATNIAILLAGLVGGWASALYSIQSLGSVPADDKGLWSTWDAGEGNDVNPYATAHFLLEGHIPPAVGLFRSYFASRDGEGNKLEAGCTYAIAAESSGLRWWSFSTGRRSGEDEEGTISITSDEAMAMAKGVEIFVSPKPVPGNWLQPPSSGNLQFVYMIASDSKLGDDDSMALPSIRKVKC